MKFISIVILLFLINVAASTINALNVVEGYRIQPQDTFIEQSTQELINQEYFQSSAVQDTGTDLNFGDFTKGLSIFVGSLALGIIAPFYLFIQFGLSPLLAVPLSTPIYLLYGIGLAQFISNRATRSMD